MAPPTSEGRASSALAWTLRAGGLAIALVQGVYLPLTGQSALISPPLCVLAAGMMGVAQGIVRDAARRRK